MAPSSVTTTVQFSLDRGERQLWAGVPRQGLTLGPNDLVVVPFSLLWGGFAIFWEWGVFHSGAPFFFRLWGVPFVLLGLYMMVGRFFYDSYRRARTTYAVTSDRIIIQSGGGSLKSIPIRTLGEVTLRESADGSGTIAFGPLPTGMKLALPLSRPGSESIPMFEMIPNARTVYDIIRDAQRAPANG
jgi:hypothetical protein